MSSNWKSLGAGLGVVTILVCAIASAQDRKANAPAAVESVDVFNSVEVRSTVLTSRPDGARVEKGDVVCELDPADLRDRLASQDIVVQGASADVQGARLEREVAVIALTEYKEGLYAQDVASVEGKIKLAEAGLSRSEDQVDWVRRMFQKGYASMAEKVTEELTLKQARFGLEQAQMNRKVLVDYTKNKTIKALLGAVETARARELAKQAALERERSAHKRLADQIRRCKVTAPVAGQVRYAVPIGTGAVVHDGQVLCRIVSEGTQGPAAK